MIIYFLRHASAGSLVATPRKMRNARSIESGIEQCGYVGRALAAMDVQVDMIVSSPLKRAAQTASLVGNELSYEGKLQFEDALRPQRFTSPISGSCSTSTPKSKPSWWSATIPTSVSFWAAASAKPAAKPPSN